MKIYEVSIDFHGKVSYNKYIDKNKFYSGGAEMTSKHTERAIVKNLQRSVEEINYEFFVLNIPLIESNPSRKHLAHYIPAMEDRMVENGEYLGYDE